MIAQERERQATRPRCPWCREEGDPTGRGWIVCGRDRTPVHAACIEEFRICPICRAPLELRDIQESPRIPDAPAARSTPVQATERPHPAARFPVEGVPVGVDEAVRALHAQEMRRERDREARLGSLGGALIFALGLVFFHHGGPGVALLICCLASLGSAIFGRRPRALTREERELLEEEIAFRDSSEAAARAEAALADLEREQSQLYREALERRAPIEDAQRVRGIGPWTTERLREAGITSLYELVRRDPKEVKGVKKKRATALAAWSRDRQEGIDRLLESPDFPREELELEIQSWRVSRVDAARAASERARAARARLEALVGLVGRDLQEALP